MEREREIYRREIKVIYLEPNEGLIRGKIGIDRYKRRER